jgi:hypothetical protein
VISGRALGARTVLRGRTAGAETLLPARWRRVVDVANLEKLISPASARRRQRSPVYYDMFCCDILCFILDWDNAVMVADGEIKDRDRAPADR